MSDRGRPSDFVALEPRNRANERMISHLNTCIQDELEKSCHEFEDLDQVVAKLKAGNQSLSKQQAELKQQLSVKNGDLMRLEELLDRVTEDKKRISHRVNKLVANEKEYVLEIERLKKKNGPPLTKSNKKTVARYEAVIRVMEEEKEYYKKEYEILKATKKTISSAKATPTKGLDDPEVSKLIRERDEMTALLDKFD